MKIETEVIEYKCKNNEKQIIGIEGFLNKLKQTQQGVIQSFDISQNDKIVVEYQKINRRGFTWEEVKKQVEGELIQTIYYNPNFHGSIPRNEDFEKLIQLFYDSNPQYKKKGA